MAYFYDFGLFFVASLSLVLPPLSLGARRSLHNRCLVGLPRVISGCHRQRETIFNESIDIWNAALFSNFQLLKNVTNIPTVIEKLFTDQKFTK